MNLLETTLTVGHACNGIPFTITGESLHLIPREIEAKITPELAIYRQSKSKLQVNEISGVEFRKCAFDEATFVEGKFLQCIFEGCSFKETRLEKTIFLDCIFRNCSFNYAEIVSEKAFGRHLAMFDNCNFEKCDFRRITTVSTRFVECSFEFCHIDSIHIYSEFEGCNFEGKLKDTQFHGHNGFFGFMKKNSIIDCDFRKAEFEDVDFFHIDLNPDFLPVDEKLVILPNGRKDLEEWKRALYGSVKHSDVFIDTMAPSIGNGWPVSKGTLLEVYSEEKVQLLIDIVKKSRLNIKK